MLILLDLIYPNVCGLCENICKNNVCEQCEKKVKEMVNFTIVRYTNKEYDELVYFFEYENEIRKKILEYKFDGKAYLHNFFSEIIIKNEKGYSFLKKYDIITSVPIHKKRKLTRGYNQSELIAKDIVKKCPNLKYVHTLKKIKNTVAQSTLNESQRKKNIIDAYNLLKIDVRDKNMILFDDICTTGATANECCKLLKKAGAKKIAVLAIAKG